MESNTKTIYVFSHIDTRYETKHIRAFATKDSAVKAMWKFLCEQFELPKTNNFGKCCQNLSEYLSNGQENRDKDKTIPDDYELDKVEEDYVKFYYKEDSESLSDCEGMEYEEWDIIPLDIEEIEEEH